MKSGFPENSGEGQFDTPITNLKRTLPAEQNDKHRIAVYLADVTPVGEIAVKRIYRRACGERYL